ncbi:hypothetical protein JL720_9274 [Aureococcus anophagefferens]|nr:hypothetical protein JL720_9274 [Aureococcus anophagefferens]
MPRYIDDFDSDEDLRPSYVDTRRKSGGKPAPPPFSPPSDDGGRRPDYRAVRDPRESRDSVLRDSWDRRDGPRDRGWGADDENRHPNPRRGAGGEKPRGRAVERKHPNSPPPLGSRNGRDRRDDRDRRRDDDHHERRRDATATAAATTATAAATTATAATTTASTPSPPCAAAPTTTAAARTATRRATAAATTTTAAAAAARRRDDRRDARRGVSPRRRSPSPRRRSPSPGRGALRSDPTRRPAEEEGAYGDDEEKREEPEWGGASAAILEPSPRSRDEEKSDEGDAAAASDDDDDDDDGSQEAAVPLPSTGSASRLRPMTFEGVRELPVMDGPVSESQIPLLKCVLQRTKSLFGHNLCLCVEATGAKILVAKRRTRSGNYHVYDVSQGTLGGRLTKKAGNYVGKIAAASAADPHHRVLLDNDKSQARNEHALFVHRRTGTLSAFVDGAKPRQICVALPEDGDKANLLKKFLCSDKSLQILNQRQPRLVNGQYSLNFFGRATIASVKNFQLVPGDGDGNSKVVFQLGKVGANTFNLDFAAPFSPFVAFALAVSQFIG